MVKFFTRYIPPKSPSIGFDPESSLTFQSMKDETDINLIIKQYKETGTLPNSRPNAFSTRYPMFGDFSQVTDYTTAVNLVEASKEAFDSLPSAVRKRFGNNPMELVEFLKNPANRGEAEKLGLIEKKAKESVKLPQEGSADSSATAESGTVVTI